MTLLSLFLTAQANTPLDKMGEAGGPLLIILVLVVLPLAVLAALLYFVPLGIRKLIRTIRTRRRNRK